MLNFRNSFRSLSRTTRVGTVAALFFFQQIAPAAFAQSIPFGTPLELLAQPVAPDLRQALAETRDAIVSGDSTLEEKSAVIDDFFQVVESSCVSRCDVALETLSKFNQVNSQPNRDRIEALLKRALSLESDLNGVELDAPTLATLLSRLHDRMRGDPEAFNRSTRPALEALLALVEDQGGTVAARVNAINSKENRELLQNFVKQVVPSEESLRKFNLSAQKIGEMSSKLEAYLRRNPGEIEYRIQATLHAVRALIAFQEEALLLSFSRNPEQARQGRERTIEELLYFKKQSMALWGLFQIVRSISAESSRDSRRDKEKMSQEELQAKLGQVVQLIADLGLFYIKFAQTLSNVATLLPEGMGEALSVFQDGLPPMPPEQIVEILWRELGRDPREVFSEFNPADPFKNGSIAPTFIAKLKSTGEKVIIKVQRPGLARELDRNRRFNDFVMRVIAAVTPRQVAPLVGFVSDQVLGLHDEIKTELDFRSEARNLNYFRRVFALHPEIRVPEPVRALTTRNVLVMKMIPGTNLEKAVKSGDRVIRDDYRNHSRVREMDRGEMSAQDKTRREAAEAIFAAVYDSLLYSYFIVGEAHADLQSGNVLAQSLSEVNERDNTLGLIDFAQTVRTRGLISAPLKASFALLTGNPNALAKALVKMGADPNYPSDRLVEAITRIFEEKGVTRRSLRDVLNGRFSHSQPDILVKVFGEVIRHASVQLGYVASPRYAQVVRSLLPAGGSLVTIGKELPGTRIAILMSKGIGRTFTVGALRYAVLSIPASTARLVERGLDRWADYRQSRRRTEIPQIDPWWQSLPKRANRVQPTSCPMIFAPN